MIKVKVVTNHRQNNDVLLWPVTLMTKSVKTKNNKIRERDREDNQIKDWREIRQKKKRKRVYIRCKSIKKII